jgi:hypothetical protein
VRALEEHHANGRRTTGGDDAGIALLGDVEKAVDGSKGDQSAELPVVFGFDFGPAGLVVDDDGDVPTAGEEVELTGEERDGIMGLVVVHPEPLFAQFEFGRATEEFREFFCFELHTSPGKVLECWIVFLVGACLGEEFVDIGAVLGLWFTFWFSGFSVGCLATVLAFEHE